MVLDKRENNNILNNSLQLKEKQNPPSCTQFLFNNNIITILLTFHKLNWYCIFSTIILSLTL